MGWWGFYKGLTRSMSLLTTVFLNPFAGPWSTIMHAEGRVIKESCRVGSPGGAETDGPGTQTCIRKATPKKEISVGVCVDVCVCVWTCAWDAGMGAHRFPEG